MEIQTLTQERLTLISQLQQHQALLEDQEQEIHRLQTELTESQDNIEFYKTKYEEIREVMESCRN